MIYLAFDLHIGYDWNPDQYDRIWQFQKLIRSGDTVIYGGDTYEYAWLRKEEVDSKPEYRRFKDSQTSRTYELDGNHDLASLEVHMQSWELGGTTVMHGHQFDSTCNSAWERWYYTLAPWARQVWFNSPWQDKQNNNTGWQHHNLFILGNAIRYVEPTNIKTLVLGHVHDSYRWYRNYSGKTVICVGSLPEDGVYATYDGSVMIHQI